MNESGRTQQPQANTAAISNHWREVAQSLLVLWPRTAQDEGHARSSIAEVAGRHTRSEKFSARVRAMQQREGRNGRGDLSLVFARAKSIGRSCCVLW